MNIIIIELPIFFYESYYSKEYFSFIDEKYQELCNPTLVLLNEEQGVEEYDSFFKEKNFLCDENIDTSVGITITFISIDYTKEEILYSFLENDKKLSKLNIENVNNIVFDTSKLKKPKLKPPPVITRYKTLSSIKEEKNFVSTESSPLPRPV